MRTDRNEGQPRKLRSAKALYPKPVRTVSPNRYGISVRERPRWHTPEASAPMPRPIWFAALMASSCQAKANGENRAVQWDCIAGHALYTNTSALPEQIEPFGIHLEAGHTLAVFWRPGETDYTLEVYAQSNHFYA